MSEQADFHSGSDSTFSRRKFILNRLSIYIGIGLVGNLALDEVSTLAGRALNDNSMYEFGIHNLSFDTLAVAGIATLYNFTKDYGRGRQTE